MSKHYFHVTGQHDIGELLYFLNELREEKSPQNIMVTVEVTQHQPPIVFRSTNGQRTSLGNMPVSQKG